MEQHKHAIASKDQRSGQLGGRDRDDTKVCGHDSPLCHRIKTTCDRSVSCDYIISTLEFDQTD